MLTETKEREIREKEITKIIKINSESRKTSLEYVDTYNQPVPSTFTQVLSLSTILR